jgi:hypothetical protein
MNIQATGVKMNYFTAKTITQLHTRRILYVLSVMQNLVTRKFYLEQRKVCLIKVTSYFRQSIAL